MPIFAINPPAYKNSKPTTFDWNTFVGGLNTLLLPNEIAPNELSQSDNLVLIGKGIPTKRWGLKNYFAAGATGIVRGIKGFYKSDGTNELLAMTDQGYLVKKNSGTFSQLNGVSWASGNNAQMVQLNNNIYIVNGQRALARYSSPTLVGFATIAVPTIVGASNISNATGTSTKGYKVSAISNVGETLSSSTFELKSQPNNLKFGTDASIDNLGGVIRLQWTGPSTASGILQGYNIYGRSSGYETFLASADAQTTTWLDDGTNIPSGYTYPPLADSTGGPIASYVIRFQDRLVFAGISGQQSKVIISGPVPNHEKFDLGNGGNYALIEPDSGDNITGLQAFKDKIIVFKQRSIWQITLNVHQQGNFVVTTPVIQLITSARGCISGQSVLMVENDIFYLSDRGVHSLGFQFGFQADQLRSNEVSGKIRPYFLGLTYAQKSTAVAAYFDYKYFLFLPGSGQTMVYDVLRQAWMGPWSFDANSAESYIDSSNINRLLVGSSTNFNINETSSDFSTDLNVTIPTTLRTKKEDFGDWSVFKTLKNVLTQMKNVTGTVAVNIQLEQRSGNTVTAKTFNVVPVTGVTGWGSDMWGSALWGSSNNKASNLGNDASDVIRWARVNQACRTMQLVLQTTNSGDNYQLLAIEGEAKLIGSGFRPSSWSV